MQGIVVGERTLTNIVQQAFQRPNAVLESWQSQAIDYRMINHVTAGLYRISGTSMDCQGSHSWSLILKILQHNPEEGASKFGSSDDPTHWNYWRREASAYCSNLLQHLPVGCGVPRCYAVSEETPTTLWLWLEDIQGIPAKHWSLQRFQLAAQHLGQFQGQYAAKQNLPSYPWLNRQWLRAWVPSETTVTCDRIANPTLWQHPLLVPHLSHTHADRVVSLWHQRASFLATIERMPQTVCHLDFWPPNLFARETPDGQDQTVLIDWAQVGLGACGEDIANLILDSVWMFEVDRIKLAEFEHLVWEGYLTGLHQSGWVGDVRQIRFVYAATAALRFGLLAGLLLQQVQNQDEYGVLEQRYQRPLDQIMAQRASTVAHALHLADEAEALLPYVTET